MIMQKIEQLIENTKNYFKTEQGHRLIKVMGVLFIFATIYWVFKGKKEVANA